MFKSMTGFARLEFEHEGISGCIQAKSYNNRYLEIGISLPPQLSAYESGIHQYIGSRMNRGKIEFSIRLRSFERPVNAKANLEAARAVYEAVSKIGKACGIGEQPSLQVISSFEGVLQFEKDFDADSMWPAFLKDIEKVFGELEEEKLREGRATEEDIFSELDRFGKSLAIVEENAAAMEENIRRQLTSRFQEILPRGFDEQRVLQETAVQLVRFGINEEISRLKAHIAAFRDHSKQESPAKKLDFLCQEMNREVNTIGSKNIMVEIAHAVVDMKDALENIREQLRNVE